MTTTEAHVLDLAARIVTLDDRAGAARALAREVGASDLIVFVKDAENGMLLPAVGFRQTLPDAKTWRAFLARCVSAGVAREHLSLGDEPVPALGLAVESAVLVLLGGSPLDDSLESLRRVLPLLGAALENEHTLKIATLEAAALRAAVAEHARLAAALDVARARADTAALEAHRRATLAADVGVALTKAGPITEALRAVVEAIVRNLGAAFARVWTLDEGSDVLELRASAGLYTRLDGSHSRVPVGSFKIGLIARDRRPHYTNDVIGDPHVRDHDWARREGLTSFAGLPLVVGDRLVGVMALFARHPLTDDVLLALGSLADAVATAIERRRTEERLAEEARRVEILHRVGAALLGELDLERLVQRVTDEARTLTGAAFAAFFYKPRPEKGDSLLLYTLSGAPREAFASFPMPRMTAIFAPTLSGAGSLRSDDVTKDPRYGKNAPLAGMPQGHLPVRSYLGVPVISRTGEVLGGLFFGHPEVGVFDERDERLVRGVAGQAAIAMDNARLHESMQRSQVELERAVRARDDLLAVVSHDLRNPLGVIAMNAALLSKNAAEGTRPRKWAEAAARAADRMARLISDLLDVARIETGTLPVTLRPQPVALLVKDALEALHPLASAKQLILDGDVSGTETVVSCDRDRIAQVFSNLIGNAIKFTPEGGSVIVKAQSLEGEVAFSVADTGPGIAPDALERVWERGWQVRPDAMRGSLGLGLYITKAIVTAHGGRAWVESELGKGTTFWFTLRPAAES